MTPFFSIILPTYNREKMIPVAIQSVIDQRYPAWELIIIDDGSTDNTRQLIKSFSDERIKYVYQDNSERSVARNHGISLASGQYICFLDSDDYYLPEHLSSLHQKITDSGSQIAFYYAGSCSIEKGKPVERPQFENMAGNNAEFILRAVIATPQACIHKAILNKHKFNPCIRIGEDMELWMRIVNEFPVIFSERYTVVQPDHEDRSVNEKKHNTFKEQLQTLKIIFHPQQASGRVSSKLQKEMISYCYFGMARHHIHRRAHIKAIQHLIMSLWICPGHVQSKHKLYLILQEMKNLLTFKKD